MISHHIILCFSACFSKAITGLSLDIFRFLSEKTCLLLTQSTRKCWNCHTTKHRWLQRQLVTHAGALSRLLMNSPSPLWTQRSTYFANDPCDLTAPLLLTFSSDPILQVLGHGPCAFLVWIFCLIPADRVYTLSKSKCFPYWIPVINSSAAKHTRYSQLLFGLAFVHENCTGTTCGLGIGFNKKGAYIVFIPCPSRNHNHRLSVLYITARVAGLRPTSGLEAAAVKLFLVSSMLHVLGAHKDHYGYGDHCLRTGDFG